MIFGIQFDASKAASVNVSDPCADNLDNDGNGLRDANDPACAPAPEDICDDGIDNDNDGLIDCADRTDCDDQTQSNACGVGVCASTGSLTCHNGTLEDSCIPGDPTEPGTELTCDDGLDNDCDGLTDGDDSDCLVDCSVYDGNRTACRNAGCRYSNRTGLCTNP